MAPVLTVPAFPIIQKGRKPLEISFTICCFKALIFIVKSSFVFIFFKWFVPIPSNWILLSILLWVSSEQYTIKGLNPNNPFARIFCFSKKIFLATVRPSRFADEPLEPINPPTLSPNPIISDAHWITLLSISVIAGAKCHLVTFWFIAELNLSAITLIWFPPLITYAYIFGPKFPVAVS